MKKKRQMKSARGGKPVPKPAPPAAARRQYDWTLLGLDLLILVPPLVFLRGVADSFRLPKLVLGGTLALVAVAFLCLRLQRKAGPVAAWRSPAVLIAVAILAVAAGGLWTSEHPDLVSRTLPWLATGCVFLVAATHLLTESDRRRALRLMLWPAAVLAIIGLLQAFELWQPMEFQRRVGARLAITSLAGGAFDLSAFLLLPLLLAQERFWSRRDLALRNPRRFLWVFAILLFGAALVATQTLGSILAALAGSLAFWLHLAWQREVPRRRLGLVLGGGLALVVVAVLAVTPVRERVVQKVRQVQRGDVNVFLTGRLDGWRAALWMAQERPFTGVGTGAYRAEFGDARLGLQEAGVDFYAGHQQPYFVNAHNEVLEVLAEWGWPGLAAVLWLVWVVGRRMRGRMRESSEADRTAWQSFLAAATVAIVVVSLTNFPWRLALIAFPWLLVVSSVLDRKLDHRLDRESDPEGAEKEPDRPDVSVFEPNRGQRALPFVLAAAALMAALALFDAGKDRVGCQKLVQTTESLALEGARRGTLPPRARDLGLDLLRRAEELDPAEVSVPITEGGLFMVAGRLEAAERAYREALAMENRSEIWINLARLHLSAGDRAKALEAARMAQRLDSRVARKMPEFPELGSARPNRAKKRVNSDG